MTRYRLMLLLATTALLTLTGALAAQQVDPAAARRQLFEALQNRGANETVQILPVQRATADQLREAQRREELSEDVQAGPARRGNVAEEVFDEFEGPPAAPEPVVEPARTIHYEVTILHLASPRDFSQDETEISDENVAERIAQWREQGRVAHASTIRFASLDQMQGYVQFGESVPVVVGRSAFAGGRGGFQTQANYQEVGTLLTATGRIDGDGVVMEMQIEQSRLEPSGTPIEPEDEATGAEAAQSGTFPGSSSPGASTGEYSTTRQFKTQTTVTVPDGGTVVLSGAFQRTDAGSKGTIVTLRVRIGD